MNRSFIVNLAGVLLSILITEIFAGCDSIHRNSTHQGTPLLNIERGKELAAVYCSSCHALPDPLELDATTWEKKALPAMGPRLGIFNHLGESYSFRGDDKMKGPGFYTKAVITQDQWQNIMDYYTSVSPDQLSNQQRISDINMNLPLFRAESPALYYKGAMTSFVKIGDSTNDIPLMMSDAGRQKTYFLNKALQPVDSINTEGPLVDAERIKNTLLACNIGVLNPNDDMYGKAVYLRKDSGGKWKADSANLFEQLRRPVQITAADLNNDGRTDYLVCEFGYLNGSLSWMENTGSGFQRHVLRSLPGAIKAYLRDYNKDGRPDIWVLFAQADEGIFTYTNLGNGRFEEKRLLRFPAVYGSTYFELDDFNKDGHPDIIYTCGDNGDYSTVLKPYHGIYIYENNGQDSFIQKYFFPQHGCYKAIAKDFDKDGDLDIAAISYFADFADQPEEGFVYLENKSGYDFEPYTLPSLAEGRWLTMDAGDVDGDGWTDIVLGNFCLGASNLKSKYDWRNAPPVVVLKNTHEAHH